MSALITLDWAARAWQAPSAPAMMVSRQGPSIRASADPPIKAPAKAATAAKLTARFMSAPPTGFILIPRAEPYKAGAPVSNRLPRYEKAGPPSILGPQQTVVRPSGAQRAARRSPHCPATAVGHRPPRSVQ